MFRSLGAPFRSPWLLHLRPKSWPTVAGHVLAGSLMAKGLGAFETPLLWKTIGGCAIWAICLNGGTLAFNSAFDRDEGDVGFLRKPPSAPDGLAAVSMGLMLLGAGGAFLLSLPYFFIYIFSLVMSWLYSAPPANLKKRGGWDVVVNGVGYGALTALAGWFAVGKSLAGPDCLIFVGYGFLFAAVYPMTQIYQRDEDRRSGVRTLALKLGDRGSMIFIHGALVMTFASWILFSFLCQSTLSSWFWVAGIGVAWFTFSLHWWATFDRYPHQKGLYRAMGLWAFTNVALVFAFFYGSGNS